jgi:hypothetical protein
MQISNEARARRVAAEPSAHACIVICKFGGCHALPRSSAVSIMYSERDRKRVFVRRYRGSCIFGLPKFLKEHYKSTLAMNY